MRSKYIPKKIAGKKVGLDGRINALIVGSLLIATGPVYFVSKVIAKGREYIRGEPDTSSSIDEFIDTLKICYEGALKGRLPQRDN